MEKDPILKDPTVAQPTAIMGTKNIRACGAKAPHSTCSLFFVPTGSKPLCRSPEKRPVLAIGPQQTVDNNTVLAKGDSSYRYQYDDID